MLIPKLGIFCCLCWEVKKKKKVFASSHHRLIVHDATFSFTSLSIEITITKHKDSNTHLVSWKGRGAKRDCVEEMKFSLHINWFCWCLLVIDQSTSVVAASNNNKPPDVSELPSSKTFKILGMSVYDNPNENAGDASNWWKWFMPSFYKQNLKGLNVDLTPQNKWTDTSYCQLRYYGFLKKLGSEGYWDGGYGTLTVPKYDKPLKCYYQSAAQSHVNIGHGSKHAFEREQAAKQLMAFAIYCPLPKERKQICEILDTKTVTSELRLYPVGWEKTHMAFPPYEYLGCTFSSKKGRLDLQQIKPNMITSAQQFLPSTELLVCTVQTFQNEMSGPMLYMFALHYSTLGFQVVIYDRFGKHLEFVQELIDSYYVIYHPFTAYEIGLPDEYNAEKSKNAVCMYIFLLSHACID